MRRGTQKRGSDPSGAAHATAAAAAARCDLERRLVEPPIQLGNRRTRLGPSRVRDLACGVGFGPMTALALFERRLGGRELLGATALCREGQ